ncbi:MAG: MFS transporter, partial [Alphaproteobacteria bacterium]
MQLCSWRTIWLAHARLLVRRQFGTFHCVTPAITLPTKISTGETMAGQTQTEVPVSRLLDERGLSSFQIKLLIWSFFIVLIDGYDIGAIAFAAPSLVRAWGLKPGELGPVFSASLVGILFGSALFGWVGDRYGRKAALIGSNLLFGVFTLAAAYSSNLTEMFWLRLLAGVGIGGVIPNVVAINAESAPRNLRATLAIIAVGCVPIGGAIPGFVTATLVPTYGWPILFQIGGIVPILIGLAGLFGLPESIKYMAIHERQRGKMEALIGDIRPDFAVPPDARFVIEDEKQFPGFNPAYLFGQGLALITPLLWLLFALNLMGYFFLLSWTPTLLTAAKLPPATAALAGAVLQVGGTVGSLSLCWWLQRHRFLAIAIMFVLAVPVVGSIGFAGLTSASALLTATFFPGFLVLGIQSGIN